MKWWCTTHNGFQLWVSRKEQPNKGCPEEKTHPYLFALKTSPLPKQPRFTLTLKGDVESMPFGVKMYGDSWQSEGSGVGSLESHVLKSRLGGPGVVFF